MSDKINVGNLPPEPERDYTPVVVHHVNDEASVPIIMPRWVFEDVNAVAWGGRPPQDILREYDSRDEEGTAMLGHISSQLTQIMGKFYGGEISTRDERKGKS